MTEEFDVVNYNYFKE